jgi:hypothetical protein
MTENETTPAARLEYLRGELRAERISYGGLAELAELAEHIEPGDVELLEAAGVPEFPERPSLRLVIEPADGTATEVCFQVRHLDASAAQCDVGADHFLVWHEDPPTAMRLAGAVAADILRAGQWPEV